MGKGLFYMAPRKMLDPHGWAWQNFVTSWHCVTCSCWSRIFLVASKPEVLASNWALRLAIAAVSFSTSIRRSAIIFSFSPRSLSFLSKLSKTLIERRIVCNEFLLIIHTFHSCSLFPLQVWRFLLSVHWWFCPCRRADFANSWSRHHKHHWGSESLSNQCWRRWSLTLTQWSFPDKATISSTMNHLLTFAGCLCDNGKQQIRIRMERMDLTKVEQKS